MATATLPNYILIGTAGHIDHGKTRLVKCLTKIDTDRLPEEQARGISIDLGFAHWEADGFQFGIVDVPGHERFVKNMVAGATGVNLAMLVVAADDGVMPQTREHLEIMDLLGIRTGVVAITKTDLVDPDFVQLVGAEIEDLTAGTFLEGAPVVAVSSETGAGIDALKDAVLRVAGTLERETPVDLFRMPIDRVFALEGHGTVVTGSVLSGEVDAGQTVELLPMQRPVRVRSVHHHGKVSTDGGPRQRTALNLGGVKVDEIVRGHEVATPGYLQPTMRIVVRVRSLGSTPILLKDRLEVSLHAGTSEVRARLILKNKSLSPGKTAYAELRTRAPVVAAYGQPFILRRISPAHTIAGGIVLDPGPESGKRIKDLQLYGESLDSPSSLDRLSFHCGQLDVIDESPLPAAWKAGIRPDRYPALIEQLTSSGMLTRLQRSDRRLLIHRGRLQALSASVLRTVKAELDRRQPRRSLRRTTLHTACREISRSELLEAVFDHLLETGQLINVGENIGFPDAQVQLTKNQQSARRAILDAIATGGLSPPTAKELAAATGQKPDQIGILLNLCVEEGLLVRVSDALHFSPDALEQARQVCENRLRQTGEATMSQLREAWGVSRKFSVPLCEYFDAAGITVRHGDQRTAGPRIGDPIDR